MSMEREDGSGTDHSTEWTTPAMSVAVPNMFPAASIDMALELTNCPDGSRGWRSTAEPGVPLQSNAWITPTYPHPTCMLPFVSFATDSVKPDRVLGFRSTADPAVPVQSIACFTLTVK